MSYLLIMLGGGAGSIFRYLVSAFLTKHTEGGFPWGTLAVNLVGCFLIGFLWELFESRAIAPNARLFIFTGFLGGFTTFSTFGLETVNLMRGGDAKLAVINIAVSNLAGVLLVVLGFAVCKLLINLTNNSS